MDADYDKKKQLQEALYSSKPTPPEESNDMSNDMPQIQKKKSGFNVSLERRGSFTERLAEVDGTLIPKIIK